VVVVDVIAAETAVDADATATNRVYLRHGAVVKTSFTRPCAHSLIKSDAAFPSIRAPHFSN
jgi:hypothetical protein